jgi:CBS domain-containing protein
MGGRDVGAVVVTRGGEPVGVLTERDVMRKCCPADACRDMRVGDIMSQPLITVEADTPIGQAAQLMASKNIRRLLVKEKGAIVGIVTIRDVMRGTLDVFGMLGSL